MTDQHTQILNATKVILERNRDKIGALIDQILEHAKGQSFGDSSLFAIRLAIEEAITNAFEHGHEHLDPSLPIQVEYAVSETDIQIAVQDQGPGFSPADLPDPTLQENLSKPSGRGVMLMKAYMTDVAYNEKGNRVKLRFESPSL
ncbi:MAG: ATP-binding protein [Phycisphaerales bacterium]|nr:ATP-binding protein [Phycisphaerales bacterium]